MTGVRVGMWSGPRNISTAMMRAFENRPDTFVCDEPLYAHYLLRSDKEHPGRDEVIAHHETDWHKVVAYLTGPVPQGKAVFYQKHMTHHLLPHISRDWLLALSNAFLIRDPDAVLVSLSKVLATPLLEDTGLPQQVALFDYVCEQTGHPPPVLDARDVLQDPRRALTLLCAALDIEFTDHMLSWPPGPRETDGIWARHWYRSVEQSTGFGHFRPLREPVPAHLEPLREPCQGLYARLHAHRLR